MHSKYNSLHNITVLSHDLVSSSHNHVGQLTFTLVNDCQTAANPRSTSTACWTLYREGQWSHGSSSTQLFLQPTLSAGSAGCPDSVKSTETYFTSICSSRCPFVGGKQELSDRKMFSSSLFCSFSCTLVAKRHTAELSWCVQRDRLNFLQQGNFQNGNII